MLDNNNRLLVVDADAEVAAVIRSAAAGLGFTVTVAAELAEFLRLSDEFRPSAIIMDMEIGGADGVEALRALATRGCKAAVLLMGETDRRVLGAAMNLGTTRGLAMSGMLSKPFGAQDLQTLLAQVYRPERKFGSGDVERGLDADEFVAFYQPKASLAATGGWRIDGLEALVRWQHPSLGLVMPDEFIPLAERTGQIGRLTESVLQQTLASLRTWDDSGLALTCSVNLPPGLVTDLDFPDRIADAIAQHDVDPQRLSLELTESATMRDPTTTMDILTRLRVKNIGLSIDDFGTGYSSLTRLYQMPFDEMKIDKSLVMNVPRSREANTIVGSLIELAHSLDLKVCAEGVESRAALDLLEVLQCDRCQGFYMSRALPAADIARFVTNWNAQNPASAHHKPVPAVV